MSTPRRVILMWDYESTPLWVDGANVENWEEVVGDPETVAEILEWWSRFAAAEETLMGDDPEERQAATTRMVRELVPQGKSLAQRFGAKIVVDWGNAWKPAPDPQQQRQLLREVMDKHPELAPRLPRTA